MTSKKRLLGERFLFGRKPGQHAFDVLDLILINRVAHIVI